MKKRRLLLTALAVPALAAPRVHPPKDASAADAGTTDAGTTDPGTDPGSNVDTRQEDPVLKARATRAAAQGIDERDLPPMPKTLVEPPPLPPPETHPKDMPGYRAKHRRSRHRGKAHKAKPKSRATAQPRRAARHK